MEEIEMLNLNFNILAIYEAADENKILTKQ